MAVGNTRDLCHTDTFVVGDFSFLFRYFAYFFKTEDNQPTPFSME